MAARIIVAGIHDALRRCVCCSVYTRAERESFFRAIMCRGRWEGVAAGAEEVIGDRLGLSKDERVVIVGSVLFGGCGGVGGGVQVQVRVSMGVADQRSHCG